MWFQLKNSKQFPWAILRTGDVHMDETETNSSIISQHFILEHFYNLEDKERNDLWAGLE